MSQYASLLSQPLPRARRARCTLSALACSVLLTCSAGTALAKEVVPAVAQVNGVAISQARFDQALAAARQQGNVDSPQLRIVIKNQLIATEIMRQAAQKRGYQNDPQVLEVRDAAMIQKFLKESVKPALVAETAVRARYDAIVGELGDQEWHYRIIAVADAAKAADLLAQLKTGKADFAELARANSLLPSRERGGEMDWVSFKTPIQEGHTQGLPTPVAQALSALPSGAVSAEPVLWDGKQIILRVEEARPTRVPEYDAVKASLRQVLETQALEKATVEFVTQLVSTARIQQ
jgi:peptidyl-prolyl cis-trans isomerase C